MPHPLQLSVGRKLSGSTGSSSMDDIFVALCTSPPIEEEKRHSTYTESLVEQLTAPHTAAAAAMDVRTRRVSAPEGRSPVVNKGSTSLDQVGREGGRAVRGWCDHVMIM